MQYANKRPVATGWLQTVCVIIFLCVKEKYAISFFLTFINSQGKQRKVQIFLILLLFVKM